MASWGSEMLVEAGDLLAVIHPDANEIYRIQADAFAATYSQIPAEGAGREALRP